MRILIVDDSKTMRSILTAYAGDHGIAATGAEDGIVAWETLQKDSDFDAILIDWDMPRMDGISLLKTIRADPSFDHIKTMMVTAQSSYDRLSEALTLGADDYLMKPIDEAMFTDKLRLLGLVA
jgi:two-component system, chemotaxis family, chemotaxis protein CheY